MYEESDQSLIETAMRETEEELGVERHRWDVWGDLPPIPGVRVLLLPLTSYSQVLQMIRFCSNNCHL